MKKKKRKLQENKSLNQKYLFFEIHIQDSVSFIHNLECNKKE